jgi:hypothetical protein
MSPRVMTLVAIAGLLLVLGCGHGQNLVTSGVEGRVLMSGGVVAPPWVSPTPRPYPNTEVAIRDASGALVAKVAVGQDGRFRIALKPGRYDLVPRPTLGNPYMSSKKVTVTQDRFTTLIVWAQVR